MNVPVCVETQKNKGKQELQPEQNLEMKNIPAVHEQNVHDK